MTALLVVLGVAALALAAMVLYFARDARKWEDRALATEESRDALLAQLSKVTFRMTSAEGAITEIQNRSDARSKRDAVTIASLKLQIVRRES